MTALWMPRRDSTTGKAQQKHGVRFAIARHTPRRSQQHACVVRNGRASVDSEREEERTARGRRKAHAGHREIYGTHSSISFPTLTPPRVYIDA